MSNKLVGDSKIINPMAKTILKYEVNDQMQGHLTAPNMHPRDAAKLLMNMAMDLMFNYSEAIVEHAKIEIAKNELDRKDADRHLQKV